MVRNADPQVNTLGLVFVLGYGTFCALGGFYNIYRVIWARFPNPRASTDAEAEYLNFLRGLFLSLAHTVSIYLLTIFLPTSRS